MSHIIGQSSEKQLTGQISPNTYYFVFLFERDWTELDCVCPAASREQLRRREGSAAPSEEAGAQAHREVLVWGRSGKGTKPVIPKKKTTMHLERNLTNRMQMSWWDTSEGWYPVESAPLWRELLGRERGTRNTPPGPLSDKDVSKNAPRFCRNHPVSSCILFYQPQNKSWKSGEGEGVGGLGGALGAGGARLHLNLDVHFGAHGGCRRAWIGKWQPFLTDQTAPWRGNTEGMEVAAQSCGFRQGCFATQFAACLCSHRFVWAALLPWLFCEGFSFSCCIIPPLFFILLILFSHTIPPTPSLRFVSLVMQAHAVGSGCSGFVS